MSDIEEAARLVVRPHPESPLGVRVDLVGHAGGAVEIDLGDGSKRARLKKGGTSPVQHAYQQPGCYMVTALDKSGDIVAQQQVVVRGRLSVEGVTVSEDDGYIRVSFAELTDPTGVLPYYRIEWPDGGIEHTWGVPHSVVRHPSVPGEHELRLVDVTCGRAARFPISISGAPTHDPDFAIGADLNDPTGMTVVLRVDAVQDSPIHIWWDDADGPQVVERPVIGMEIPHRYNHPGHYMQTLAYAGRYSFQHSKSQATTVPANHSQEAWREQGQEPSGTVLESPAAPAGPYGVPSDDPVGNALGYRPVDIAFPVRNGGLGISQDPPFTADEREGVGRSPLGAGRYHENPPPVPHPEPFWESEVYRDEYPEPAPVITYEEHP